MLAIPLRVLQAWESSMETSNGVAPGEEVYREVSTYDNLLMALGSESLVNAYGKREYEEGKSDSEEEEADESESIIVSEEDISDAETDIESPRSQSIRKVQDHRTGGFSKENEEAETEDDQEASDTDQELELGAGGQSALKASVSLSSFYQHLGYKMSVGEVENLSKKKWKYDWEIPAGDMAKCKWMGTGEPFLKAEEQENSISTGYGLKQKLYKHWLDLYKTAGGDDFNSSKQRYFFSLWNSYRDVLHCKKKPFYLKGLEEDSSIMDSYIMHSLNHIFRTRDLVTKNDAKESKHQDGGKKEILTGDSFLDRGFTRPKVLILLPIKSIAFRVVKRLIQLTPTSYKVNVEHSDRFSDEFGPEDVEDDQAMSKMAQNGHNIGNSKSQKTSKPSDFQALFGGNDDDDFMVGIKFTRRSTKLYSDFYSSDMIVASPICLHRKIEISEVDKEKDVDYLSSIEVLIIDHADILAMQNWSFLTSVVEHLNRIPSKQHGTDIMRIRPWYLDGYAKYYRQTIILSYHLNPEMNALFNHHCVNYKGKVKLVCKYKGVLPKVLIQVPQIYCRFDAASVADADDARLDYFVKKVFPKIKDSIQGGIMLFISTYFEYVRIRNFLKSQGESFCLLGDYAKAADISRARVWFFEGKRKIMLCTERFHFYFRYKIRGIKNLIIYSLPERKRFYPEIVNMLEGSHEMTCTVLFSRFDLLRLERIVGTDHARKMIKSEKHVFTFC
ncbi:U3 small nucleolar RNA-associated protein 25 [Tripterygium wilfordii]|uniref:U3 small nucleolar RNA-associated protein 25 n=1 Tax=Tripterygium wilfordii TaxID=458696 RepID=A0A7J7C240_TRIWF|nr:U3 small nucleolar RNA-associated protein 25 [Tripterygium wilfordii]